MISSVLRRVGAAIVEKALLGLVHGGEQVLEGGAWGFQVVGRRHAFLYANFEG